MNFNVRVAGLSDVERAAPLFDAYRGFYGQTSDLGRARAWLTERLTRGEATLLLARAGDAAVGFSLLYPSWSSVSTGPVLLLNDLFVLETARRAGVALALLQAAAEHGRAHGALRLVLETARDNHAAQALYRRAGWIEEQTQWFHLPLAGTARAH